jgi:hypothetical protein
MLLLLPFGTALTTPATLHPAAAVAALLLLTMTPRLSDSL